MGEVVNLRRARKGRARAEEERRAAQSRRLHGRPKAERRAEEAERALAERRLDGSHLAPDPDRDDGSRG